MSEIVASVSPRVEPQGWGKRPDIKVIVYPHRRQPDGSFAWCTLDYCQHNLHVVVAKGVPYYIAVIPREE